MKSTYFYLFTFSLCSKPFQYATCSSFFVSTSIEGILGGHVTTCVRRSDGILPEHYSEVFRRFNLATPVWPVCCTDLTDDVRGTAMISSARGSWLDCRRLPTRLLCAHVYCVLGKRTRWSALHRAISCPCWCCGERLPAKTSPCARRASLWHTARYRFALVTLNLFGSLILTIIYHMGKDGAFLWAWKNR
jgi:hypothetical protein